MNPRPPPPSSSPPAPAPAERSVLDWARDEGEAARLIADLDRHLRLRRRRRLRAASAVAAVLLLGGLVWRPWQTAPVTAPAGHATVLHVATRTLADGSVVELNANAEIAVDFSGPLRRVTLLRGEGHFQVAKDAHRPFVVAAGAIEVRAVGTAFSVERTPRGVDVLVTEGRVAVEQPTPPAPHPSLSPTASLAPAPLGTLDAGRRLVVTLPPSPGSEKLSAAVVTVSTLEMQQRLAWRMPRLEFSATPLVQAIALFNTQAAAARREQRLALGDPSLGALQLSGVLRADDLESLLRLLEGEFQIRPETQGHVITLRRR